MIKEFCPVYNEKIISALKIEEHKKLVDNFFLTESDRSFSYNFKGFDFNINDNNVIVLHQNSNLYFKKWNFIQKMLKKTSNKITKNKDFYFDTMTEYKWYNEAQQRNFGPEIIGINNDDIIIFSDIDEIINQKYFEQIIDLVNKYQIITLRLHFTFFFLNLFSQNWPGPDDYSYRVFIMTGKKYKSLNITSDRLRKYGEKGLLKNEIFCPKEVMGFHHSWLGDEKFVANKLKNYAHSKNDHTSEIFNVDGSPKINIIKKLILEKKSLFPGHELIVDNNIEMLDSVKNNLSNYKDYLI